jgi:hypothetical protein
VQYVVLFVIAVAAVLIAIDTVRQRTNARRRPRIDHILASALAAPSSGVDLAGEVDRRLRPPGVAPRPQARICGVR